MLDFLGKNLGGAAASLIGGKTQNIYNRVYNQPNQFQPDPWGTLPGMPAYPVDFGAIPMEGDQLREAYQLQAPQALQYGGSVGGLEALRKTAQGPLQTPWLNPMLERQQIEQQRLLGQVTAGAAQQAAQARSSLAQAGGLSGGARERLAKQASTQGLFAQQGVRQQGAMDRLGLEAGALQQARQAQLGAQMALPGMELARDQYTSGIDKFNMMQQMAANMYNIGGAREEMIRRQQGRMGQYQEQARQAAAGKTAEAIAGSGKK